MILTLYVERCKSNMMLFFIYFNDRKFYNLHSRCPRFAIIIIEQTLNRQDKCSSHERPALHIIKHKHLSVEFLDKCTKSRIKILNPFNQWWHEDRIMAFVRLLFWYVFCSQWRGGKYFMTRSSLIILCEYNVVFFCNVTMRLLRTWNWISTFLQSSIKWHSGVGIDLMNNNAWML